MGKTLKIIFNLSPTIYFIFFIFGIFVGSFAMYAFKTGTNVSPDVVSYSSTGSAEIAGEEGMVGIVSPSSQSVQSLSILSKEKEEESESSNEENIADKKKSTKSAEIEAKATPATDKQATDSATLEEIVSIPVIEEIQISESGEEIIITGSDFGEVEGLVVFEYGNDEINGAVIDWSSDKITIQIPDDIEYGREYSIYVLDSEENTSEKDRIIING